MIFGISLYQRRLNFVTLMFLFCEANLVVCDLRLCYDLTMSTTTQEIPTSSITPPSVQKAEIPSEVTNAGVIATPTEHDHVKDAEERHPEGSVMGAKEFTTPPPTLSENTQNTEATIQSAGNPNVSNQTFSTKDLQPSRKIGGALQTIRYRSAQLAKIFLRKQAKGGK